MSREVLFVSLVAFVCGPLLIVAGGAPVHLRQSRCPYTDERRRWRAVWIPVLPAIVAVGLLVGWALQEPANSDERLRPFVYVTALPIGVVWLRAMLRAVWALRSSRETPAATVGLVRPQIFIAPAFASSLDEASLAAVIAHEAAHARHRDPLRLWLGQLFTDAQWPAPAARERLQRWRAAIEVARDAEACAAGVDGADLAAALVAAARLHTSPCNRALAFVSGGDLPDRIKRLLSEPAPPPSRSFAGAWMIAVVATLLIAVASGYFFGEEIVRIIPGVVG